MISDLRPGAETPPPEPRVRCWDYTHLLPAADQQRLRLLVREYVGQEPPATYIHARLLRGEEKRGQVTAVVERRVLHIEDAILEPRYRGRGLGLAMYEAALAHAHHRHAVAVARGYGHSEQAHRVHLRLAERHGTGYVTPKFYRDIMQWGNYRHRLA